MSLYNKHRPKDFPDVVGNKNTISSLEALLVRPPEERPKSFLFTGEKGTGKTTTARILAGKLGCGEDDFLEVNSADFKGIDTIRELRQKACYMPSSGESRVIFLDECHKLTNDAQNALLKLLESPPSHVYMMLATTEPEKLIDTVRDRCRIVALETLSHEKLQFLLRRTCKREGAKVPEEVLVQISKECLGSARSALVILDSIKDLPEDRMVIVASKKAEQENAVLSLCRLLMKRGKWVQIASLLKGMEEQDPETVRRAIIGYFTAVLLGKDSANAYVILCAFKEPFYQTGRTGLITACYEALNGQ